jgi:hypothetical protein
VLVSLDGVRLTAAMVQSQYRQSLVRLQGRDEPRPPVDPLDGLAHNGEEDGFPSSAGS